jgi:hypothetical protein
VGGLCEWTVVVVAVAVAVAGGGAVLVVPPPPPKASCLMGVIETLGDGMDIDIELDGLEPREY